MKWFYFIIIYLIVAIILTTSVDGKGRRGGGKSSSRGSSSRSSGSSRSTHGSSGGGGVYDGHGVSGSADRKSGGGSNWFRGIFFSRPRGYILIYRPYSHHTAESTYGGKSYSYQITTPFPEAESAENSKTVLIGYTIGRVLSSDFYSLFNIVSDISKYTDDRKKYGEKIPIETTTEQVHSTTELTVIDNPYQNFGTDSTTTDSPASNDNPYQNIRTDSTTTDISITTDRPHHND